MTATRWTTEERNQAADCFQSLQQHLWDAATGASELFEALESKVDPEQTEQPLSADEHRQFTDAIDIPPEQVEPLMEIGNAIGLLMHSGGDEREMAKQLHRLVDVVFIGGRTVQ